MHTHNPIPLMEKTLSFLIESCDHWWKHAKNDYMYNIAFKTTTMSNINDTSMHYTVL